MILPHSLFGRTALVLLFTFALSQGVAAWVVWRAVIEPLTARAADDLAARMVLSAQTWSELPPDTRTDFEIELSLRHGLELGRAVGELPDRAASDRFGELLVEALNRRLASPARFKQGPDPAWMWVELELAGHPLRIGLKTDRPIVAAPMAVAATFLAGALLTVLVALLLARNTTRRLARLTRSAAEVGQGRTPARLPEEGPSELAALNASFNRMADQVRTLLENRTVLLAGLSHDLRTPLTRLRLALSMLEGGDAHRVQGMERDIEEMNTLIGQTLDFARSLRPEATDRVDLAQLLDRLCQDVAQDRAKARLTPAAQAYRPCLLAAGALRRVLGNLLENALRHGGEAPVEVELDVDAGGLVVRVLDRGPGIPATEREAVFQPFHRLERSRARDTGGSGLGLAIARQLADAQGWRIRLSDRAGGGLSAEVWLPCLPDSPAPAQ